MALSDLWKTLDSQAMSKLASAWLTELRDGSATEESNVGQSVVMMNFMAPPTQRWLFIRLAVEQAGSDDALGHIAAGPLEHILGHHGEEYIVAVEDEAARSAKFARMLTGAWEYMMPADVWRRVQAIQARVPNPLKPSPSEGGDASQGAVP
jgi:hypothetical protein